MAAPDQQLVAQGIAYTLGLLALVPGALVYGYVFSHLRRIGGGVNADGFRLPELLVAIVLASLFGGLVVFGLMKGPPAKVEMTSAQILESSLTFAVIGLGLAGFLHYRGLRLPELFGFRKLAVWRIGGWALLLFVAVFPFVLAVGWIIQQVLGEDASEQDLVRLFRLAAERHDLGTIGAIIVAGVIVAPIFEEFLFRGFFYGVGKRFVGAHTSGFVTALLFAAFHGSLTALPGLLVLAFALTFAYERTGNLAVPMTMHAIFNGTSLGVLYLQASGQLSP